MWEKVRNILKCSATTISTGPGSRRLQLWKGEGGRKGCKFVHQWTPTGFSGDGVGWDKFQGFSSERLSNRAAGCPEVFDATGDGDSEEMGGTGDVASHTL